MGPRVFAALVFTAVMLCALPGLGGFGRLIALGVLIVSVRIVVRHGNSSEVVSGNAIQEVQSLCHGLSESISMLARRWPRALTIFAAQPAYISAAANCRRRGVFRKDYTRRRRKLLLAQYWQLLRIAQAGVERLQLHELALLRRARHHVISNDLKLYRRYGSSASSGEVSPA